MCDLALVGGTIHADPTAAPIADGVVLIQAGKISAVGSSAGSRAPVKLPPTVPTLDCAGGAITAGFWNSHMHFFERKWADVAAIPAAELGRQLQGMLTRYGFTSVFDLSSLWENTRRLRGRITFRGSAGTANSLHRGRAWFHRARFRRTRSSTSWA